MAQRRTVVPIAMDCRRQRFPEEAGSFEFRAPHPYAGRDVAGARLQSSSVQQQQFCSSSSSSSSSLQHHRFTTGSFFFCATLQVWRSGGGMDGRARRGRRWQRNGSRYSVGLSLSGATGLSGSIAFGTCVAVRPLRTVLMKTFTPQTLCLAVQSSHDRRPTTAPPSSTSALRAGQSRWPEQP